MAAQDFLLDSQVQAWLDGLEPAWTLLTFESLQALRHEPAATRTAIRIANDLSCDETAGSPIARNTLILLRAAIAHGGLPLTATGNLTRAVVAKMCTLMAWPDYDQADAFRFNKVINEPDFLPLHVVRQLVQAASLVRVQHGKLVATPLGESLLSEARQRSLLAVLFHLAFWHMDLGYFGAGCSGPGPRKMPGLCFGHCRPAPMNGNPPRTDTALHHPRAGDAFWCVGQKPLRHGGQNPPTAALVRVYRKAQLFDRLLAFAVQVELSEGVRH
jgi:hypothetical protein